MDVFLLEYRHRHGTDFSGHATHAEAETAMARIVDSQASAECPAGLAAQIQAFVRLGNFDEATSLYLEHVQSEGLDIHKITVRNRFLRNLQVVDARDNVVHLVKQFPTDPGPGDTWCGRMYFWTGQGVSLPVGSSAIRGWIPREAHAPTCLTCIAFEVDDD